MLTEQVLRGILQRLPGQTISIRRLQNLWTREEAERLERELEYWTGRYSVEKVVDGYVYLTKTTMEETAYFKEHGDYRYHSFSEVNEKFYSNQEETVLRMLGLSLAEYLWENVLLTHRFYEKTIREAHGDNYLEIGPGHGKYFCEAYNLAQFKRYVAVDISPTSIAMTEEYLKSHKNAKGGVYELLCQDATLLDPREKYDFVVIQEVLEHLEDPLGMLKTISDLLSPRGIAYALMPICAPSAAHIFLFKNREHVRDIVRQARLEIVKAEYITSHNMSVEEAEKRKLPIDAALILKRSQIC